MQCRQTWSGNRGKPGETDTSGTDGIGMPREDSINTPGAGGNNRPVAGGIQLPEKGDINKQLKQVV